MFIEMIKSEFKQLMGPLKYTLLSIAIVTGIIFFNCAFYIFDFGSKEHRSNCTMAFYHR